MFLKRKMQAAAAAVVLGAMMLATGCTVQAHAGYYYDPYGHRYYAPAEQDTYVLQWENETHRNHEDFNHRSKAERNEYWKWRHQHDHDHDHDQH